MKAHKYVSSTACGATSVVVFCQQCGRVAYNGNHNIVTNENLQKEAKEDCPLGINVKQLTSELAVPMIKEEMGK